MKTVLLNNVDRSSVGHTVEALRYAQGFRVANPDAEIHLTLSDHTVPSLTSACPWISRTYAVHLDDFGDPEIRPDALRQIPREWDYIVDNNLDVPQTGATWEELAIKRYFQLTSSAFTARAGRGMLYPRHELPDGLDYTPQTQVTLDIPVGSRKFVRTYNHDGPKIAMMLGGSSAYKNYPDVSSWIKIVAALNRALPAAKFYVTGVHRSAGRQTYTAGYSDEAIAEIMASSPNLVDCYDIGLWNQIALFESCDVLLSPSTGFAWLALCVGTPWLTLSGGGWSEYFFNNVPFYRVLPDNPDYPYGGRFDAESEGPKIPCMQPHNLEKKIPEIVEAARLLMDPKFTYEAAVTRHRENVARANVNRSRIATEPDPLF